MTGISNQKIGKSIEFKKKKLLYFTHVNFYYSVEFYSNSYECLSIIDDGANIDCSKPVSNAC